MNTTKNSGCGPASSVKCIEATNRIEAEPGHKLKKMYKSFKLQLVNGIKRLKIIVFFIFIL